MENVCKTKRRIFSALFKLLAYSSIVTREVKMREINCKWLTNKGGQKMTDCALEYSQSVSQSKTASLQLYN